MSDVKAVWRAMSKYHLAIRLMENYVYGDKTDDDYGNMEVAVMRATSDGLTEMRKARG